MKHKQTASRMLSILLTAAMLFTLLTPAISAEQRVKEEDGPRLLTVLVQTDDRHGPAF